MSSPQLRLALAGCGRIARLVHLGELGALPGVELVAVADSDPRRREDAAGRAPGARALDEWRAAVEAPDVDAVVVALPNDLHAPAAEAALAAGKHVYVEKPLAESVAVAERLVRAWRASGRVAVVGFNYRLHPLVVELREALAAGRLGEPLAMRFGFGTAARDLPAWKQDRRRGGGAFLDYGSHVVDLARHVLGQEVETVQGRAGAGPRALEAGWLQLGMSAGTGVQATFTRGAPETDRVELVGTRATATFDRLASRTLRVVEGAPGRAGAARPRALLRAHALRKLRNPGFEPSYRLALSAWAQEIRGGPARAADLEQGLVALRVIERAEASAAELAVA